MDGMATDFAALWELADHGEAGDDGAPQAAGSQAPQAASGEAPRCSATVKRTGQRCKRRPHPGATVCHVHGAGAPQVKDAAARRVQEQQAWALARRSVGEVDLTQFSDPFEALEFTVSYSHALALRLAKIVEAMPDSELRYQGKIGEQLRGEVTAAQRALADLRAASAESLKLGLAERRARISERHVDLLQEAFNAALTASGLDLNGQAKARQVLSRHLRAIDGGKDG